MQHRQHRQGNQLYRQWSTPALFVPHEASSIPYNKDNTAFKGYMLANWPTVFVFMITLFMICNKASCREATLGSLTPLCGMTGYSRVRHNAAKLQQTVAETLCQALGMPNNSERPGWCCTMFSSMARQQQVVYTLQCLLPNKVASAMPAELVDLHH